MTFTVPSRVHFIGIGGAGMSAIAKVLIERGVTVTGSDLKSSRASTMLEALGAKISIGHEATEVDGADVVVVSTAIRQSNPAYRRAEELKLEIMGRGAALAAILEPMRSIVVAGTHGKTTTTSMIATILRTAGLDPTYLIGAGLNDVGTNARAGSTDIAVAESDESDGSFLLLSPSIAAVTNIELDHVDHWGTMEELRAAFVRFISSGPEDGAVIVPGDDEPLLEAARSLDRVVITTGEAGDVGWANVRLGTTSTFELVYGGERAEVELRVPGMHNVWNATTAAACCSALGIPIGDIAEGLGVYRGVERRYQLRGTEAGVSVVDDYAHHPTEVRATLAAACSGSHERVVAVFQPHRYSRTEALAAEFGSAFADADHVVLMEIYGAGEDPVPGVTGRLVAESIEKAFPDKSVVYFAHRDEVVAHLGDTLVDGDLVLTLGAGDVTTIGDEILERLAAR